MQSIKSFHLLVLLAICSVAAACEKVPLTAPTDSTIAVIVSSTSVPINGSVEVIATVTESSGTAVHNGTTVTFLAGFGHFEPTSAQTSGGRAIVRFIGTGSGTTTITAMSGGASVESGPIRVGAAASEVVTVRAEPGAVGAGGGRVTVIARVLDAVGNALPNAPITFSTDAGSLSSTSGTTDANGEARVELLTNVTARVTATAGTKSGTVQVALIDSPRVTVTTNTPTPNVGVPVSFTVTATPATGGLPISNVTVDFGDGNVRNLGAVTGANTVANTYQNTGTYTVRATVRDSAGQETQGSTTVNVGRLQPSVTLSLSPQTITAGGTSTATVTATPASGGPPLSNVSIRQGGVQIYNGTSGGSVTRQFTTAGTYNFEASATDTAGTTSTTSATLIVTGRSAIEMTLDAFSTTGNAYTCNPPSNYPKVCSGADLKVGTAISLQAGFVGSAPTNVVSYTWDFGDGTSVVTTTRNTSKFYANAGPKVVVVTVNTADGNSGSQQITLNVAP